MTVAEITGLQLVTRSRLAAVVALEIPGGGSGKTVTGYLRSSLTPVLFHTIGYHLLTPAL